MSTFYHIRGCIGDAKTGSGKTMAFAIPILQKLSEDPYGIYALVLTPTRELAFLSEQFVILGGLLNLRTAVIASGMDVMQRALELGGRPHVAVATPGGLVDHMDNNGDEWSLSRLRLLIYSIQGSERETATCTPVVENLANAILHVSKPRTAAYLAKLLQTLGIHATALHSRLKQRERLNSLNLFRSRVVPVLISTDVGARGLDIADVALVVNWDFPSAPEEYTHRVGRTARAGRNGMAISFVTERDEEKIHKVEARIGTKLTELSLPESKVLEGLNAVSTAKRIANLELHDSEFGKREEIHAKKATRLVK